MPMSLAKRAIDMLGASNDSVHIQIAGGEPTLFPDMIRQIAIYARERIPWASVGLQTNGTMIRKDLAHTLKEFNIQVGISIDGPQEVHDSLRGCFRETVKGMKLLQDHGVTFGATAVVTKRSVGALSQLALILAGFPNSAGLALDLLVTKPGQLSTDVIHCNQNDLKQGMFSLSRTISFVRNKSGRSFRFRELDLLVDQANKRTRRAYCHACEGRSMAVLPDGSVFPCSQVAGTKEFFCGGLDEIDLNRLEALSTYYLTKQDRCGACPISEVCPGDCPSRQYYNQPTTRRLVCDLYNALWESRSAAAPSSDRRLSFARTGH